MQINEQQQRIIEYLTNEMTAAQKRDFESEVKNDPSLEKDVKGFKEVQSDLSEWKNEHVEIPALSRLVTERPPGQIVKMPGWYKVAAAVLLLPLIAWLLDFQITQQGNSMALSFGPPHLIHDNSAGLLENESNEIAVGAEEKMSESISIPPEVLDSFGAQQSEFLEKWSAEYSVNIEKILANHEARQWTKLENVIARLEKEQADELNETLASLMATWESRRQEDLGRIEVAFLQIADALAKQQYETEELLTSIFYNTPAKNY